MIPKIIIDPGHYENYNRSNVVPSYYEGTRMWKLAQYLIAALKSYGIPVSCTKKTINDYPKGVKNGVVYDAVEKRGAMAEGHDLMISLHSNAVKTESVDRAVIIYPASGAEKKLATKLGETVKSVMGVSSYQLYTRKIDAGELKGQDYYGVIRASVAVGTPCIIIEHGFHTNKAVANWLMSNANLQKLAEAEAKAIADYYGVKKPTATTSDTIYRVQVGAYNFRAGAESLLANLKKAGFNGMIVESKK